MIHRSGNPFIQKVVRRRVFLAYPAEAIQAATRLENQLTLKGFSVFRYDPKSPFEDPVYSIARAIESAEYFVVLHTRGSDWLLAEKEYARTLQKPVITVNSPENASILLLRIRLKVAGLVGKKSRIASRLTALGQSFRSGSAQRDYQRSQARRSEELYDSDEFDLYAYSLVVVYGSVVFWPSLCACGLVTLVLGVIVSPWCLLGLLVIPSLLYVFWLM